MKNILMNILLAIIAFLMPVKMAMAAAIGLTAFDLIFGLLAAPHRKQKITSAGLKRTIIKIFVYEIVIALALVTETYLTQDLIPLVKLATSYIGLTELKSILENIEDITGVPALQTLIDSIVAKLKP